MPDPGGLLGIRPVADDQWAIVAWLWQAFRHDLALIVNGLPYADGRYQAAPLAQFPSPDGAGYLAWRAHPRTGEDAPVGFALIDGLTGGRRSVAGFWVAPAVRGEGVGRQLAVEALSRHDGPWSIGFQHDNLAAGRFWRGIADIAFGPGQWSEEQRPVPGKPQVPPDHFIKSGVSVQQPAGGAVTEQDPDQPAEQFRRDRHEHGGAPAHPDDDRLARLTEEERVAAGLDDYDPDEVPPATDAPPEWDVTQTEVYQEERAEIRREFDKDELQIEGERDPLPPTHYDR